MASYAERMTPPRPDLEDLDLLVLVARTGSLGRAAEELGITQPSVSRRFLRLERALRVELLQRGPRGSTLTPAGKVVVGWASTLLGAAEDFTESVDAMRQNRETTLRVAASMTIAEHLAPSWLAQLRGVSPDSVVSLSVHNSTEVAEAVEAGRADLGFVEAPAVRASLRRRRIGWDVLQIVVSPAHPWARRRTPITPELLVAEPLLVREVGSGTRETIDDALSRLGLQLTPSLTLASNSALKSSALVGIAPAVLSELAVTEELRSGQLVAVPVSGMELRRPLSVVWRDGDRLPSHAEALLRVAHVPRTGQ